MNAHSIVRRACVLILGAKSPTLRGSDVPLSAYWPTANTTPRRSQ